MEKLLIDVSQTDKVLYSKEFEVKVADDVILDVCANFTIDNCSLMVKLDKVKGDELYQTQLDVARSLFNFTEDGEDVNEYVTETTLLNTYVGFFENFAEEIQEAITSSKPINRPKGLQSKPGKSTNKPRRY